MDPKTAQEEEKRSRKYAVDVEELHKAHALEKRVPSERQMLTEHRHFVHHAEDLKALLTPIQLADVQDLGKWKGSLDIEEIPRIRKEKKS